MEPGSRLSRRVIDWLAHRFGRNRAPVSQPRGRGPMAHVVILDGTMSSLEPGQETNAGIAYRLLSAFPGVQSVYYEPGIQWQNWRRTHDVMMGRGINRQIRRAYGWLASRYRPGDRIYLMGYSRGAFAVRSLAGVIDMVGLLKADHAVERKIRDVYRYYELEADSEAAKVFVNAYCHGRVEIEMIGVWDTVKALGLRLPLVWKLTEASHAFHNHQLSTIVKNGYHALALDETRRVYDPVLWRVSEDWHDWDGRVEQVWFRGTHGDIGGQLSGFEQARPLANIPLVWMLSRAEACGLQLPDGWQDRFPCDVMAPSVGLWRGFSKLFWLRRPRVVCADRSERIHHTAQGPRQEKSWWGRVGWT